MRRATLGLFSLMGLRDRTSAPVAVRRTTVDAVKMAEDFGFDIAWFAEHHFTNHSICPNALMMVGHLAGQTARIRLGPAVLALPFHNPLRLVQEVALADLLTSGRLALGLGAGYQPYEFDRFGLDPAEKHARMLEIWDILEQGLTTGRVEHSGVHYAVKPTELSMRPFGLAPPQIFVASRAPEAVRRAARGGHTPFIGFGHRGLERALAARDALRTLWAEGGGDAEAMPLAVQRFVYVTEDRAQAELAAACVRDFARAYHTLGAAALDKDGAFVRLMPLNDEPPLDDFLETAVIGPAEHCAERLAAELTALRPTHLCCMMGLAGLGRQETLASLERFGTEVLPLLGPLVEAGEPGPRPGAAPALAAWRG